MAAWLTGCLLSLSLAVGAGARDIHSLDDFEVFRRTAGTWEGIGISFDIAPSGALAPAITYRDTWEATLSEGGRLMVMTGVTRAGGRRVTYGWRFRWEPSTETVTAEFENSLGDAASLEARVVADGRRLELRSPGEGKGRPAGDAGAPGLSLDIYLEDDDDVVIEVSLRADDGTERYRSAARYRKSEQPPGRRSKVGAAAGESGDRQSIGTGSTPRRSQAAAR